MESRKAELLQRVESDRDVLIDFLRGFIRCPSPNPPGDTREAAGHICNLLDRRGVDYRVIAPQETMPNIVATFAAAKPGHHLHSTAISTCSRSATARAGCRTPGAGRWSKTASTGAAPAT